LNGTTPVVGNAGSRPLVGEERWFWSPWIVSFILHGALFGFLLVQLPRLSRGLPSPPDPQAREVGIVLRSEKDSEVIFENAEKVYQPQPTLAPTLAESTPLEGAEFDQPADRASLHGELPKWSEPVLATQGALASTKSSVPKTAPAESASMSRTTFWNVEATGASFVFVIDRSASMSHRGALELAKLQLYQSLDQLADKSKFQVVFYNTDAFVLPLSEGNLLEASPLFRSRAHKEIERIAPEGGTNHIKPLQIAFSLRPEVIYYLTDADMLSEDDVADLTRTNRQAPVPATIFAIEFGSGPSLSSNKPLRRLAAENDGTYSYVNVLEFGSGKSTLPEPSR
jgi:hypothetical protein